MKIIYPDQLSGPRSYFTDIDPYDPTYNEGDVIRKLKLQLLTKEKIVIAASSLFHEIGYNLVAKDKGLTSALGSGIILPAIRNQFDSPKAFFENKTEYPASARDFFIEHVTSAVSWDLMDNANWFKNAFYSALREDNSLLRRNGRIGADEAQDILFSLNVIIESEPDDSQFLQRKHIEEVAKKAPAATATYLVNYSNLIYRLSGARVVNSEGHFPQSNLTKLELAGNDKLICDDSIFWDIYIETVLSFLNSAIRLTPERLNGLAFKDILTIRKVLLDSLFIKGYDRLISLAKKETTIDDPERLLLQMHEINEVANELKKLFSEKVESEIVQQNTAVRENALLQVANALALVASPEVGLIVGSLTALKSIPEITAEASPQLTTSIKNRMGWMREFVNSRIGWSEPQRRELIDAYKALVSYGLP